MRTTYPDAAPIVELRAVEMPTRFGRKSKPALKVVGWKNANARPTETAKPVERIRPIITSGRRRWLVLSRRRLRRRPRRTTGPPIPPTISISRSQA